MRCLIIDDEPAARNLLKTYIADTDELILISECKNALEARKMLKEQTIDLLFLDINMPRLSGIDFLKTLNDPPKVILTTAYSEYALDGYELDVVDYLLKPFAFERFLKAVEKAMKYSSEASYESEYITIKADGKLFRIPFDDILFVESQGDYLTVHTKENKVTFYHTLKEFSERLPDTKFAQIHRSFIVSLRALDYVEGNLVKIETHELPIGKSYKEKFLKKYIA
jgi:DNA-binding LytR/AlgR family response regulator